MNLRELSNKIRVRDEISSDEIQAILKTRLRGGAWKPICKLLHSHGYTKSATSLVWKKTNLSNDAAIADAIRAAEPPNPERDDPHAWRQRCKQALAREQGVTAHEVGVFKVEHEPISVLLAKRPAMRG